VSISRYDPEVDFDSVFELYESVGWLAYTINPEKLKAALIGSSLVLTYKINEKVIGLARCLTDGESICYLQDILVHPSHQRSGIGSSLVSQILSEFKDVRQVVLMTDAEEKQSKFYEKLGFKEIKGELRGFVRLRS
jgi:ribosomal protein S18 acetylase RimI-like enzyme